MQFFLRIVTLTTSVCLLLVTASVAATVTGSCKLATATSYRWSDTFITTGSSVFVDIPETAVGFVQGGANSSCVVVSFSAELEMQAGEAMEFRPTLDGAVPSTLGPPFFTFSSNGGITTATMTFIFGKVGPGSHQVRLQARAVGDGIISARAVTSRTTLVQYRP
jgi:hypothetical protein